MTTFTPDHLTALMAEHKYHATLERLAAADLAALSDSERGRALAIEAVCKDRIAQQEGFLSSYLTQVLEQVRPGWLFRSALAEQLVELDEDAVAEGLLRELVTQLPADGSLRLTLAGTVERQGRLEEAQMLYTEASSRAPRPPEAQLGRARCLQALGRMEEACGALGEYLAAVPEDMNAWISLAVLEAEQGRFQAANEAFDRAAGIAPDAPELLYARTVAALQQGSARAAEFAERLAETAPADWRGEAAAALVAEARGEMEPARSAMLRAFDRALTEPDAILQEGGLVQVFQFLQRHGLRAESDELEGVLHAHGILPEGVLNVLRAIRGERAEECGDYFVLVGGEAPVHAAVATGDARRTGEQWCAFVRAYHVIAVSAEAASAEALRSEGRSGGRNHRVEEVSLTAPLSGQFLGVRFRSGRMFYSQPEETGDR